MLLAGAGNTAHVFDSFAPRLTEHFHVFGITRRGFGASNAPTQGYGADRLADDDLVILESLHLVKPVVIGHSKAGQELSSIATRHPDRVSGLIYLEATYPYAYQSPGTDLKAAFDALQQRSFAFVKPPAGSDMANLPSYQAWFLGSIGALVPEADLRETLRIGPDGRVNGPRAAPETFKAYMAGEQKYTGTKAVPILAICSESHSYGAGFGKNSPDLAARFLGEEKSLLEAEVSAFAKGNPAAHIVLISRNKPCKAAR